MDFFDIGPLELFLIFVVLLIVVGPARLPEVVGAIGRGIRALKEATTELTNDFKEMADEVKDTGKEVSSTMEPVTGLPGELRDVAKEIDDARREINTALKTDMRLQSNLKKIATGSENVAKEADTAPKPAPEEEAATHKEDGEEEGQ
jgi:sec-independent protein translocase protein TatB